MTETNPWQVVNKHLVDHRFDAEPAFSRLADEDQFIEDEDYLAQARLSAEKVRLFFPELQSWRDDKALAYAWHQYNYDCAYITTRDAPGGRYPQFLVYLRLFEQNNPDISAKEWLSPEAETTTIAELASKATHPL